MSQHERHPYFSQPPLDRSLTLPEIYEWVSKHSPKHPLFVFEESPGQLRKVLWEDVSHAISRAAKICSTAAAVSEDGAEAPVVAILGALDSITFTCLFLGIMRAGCVVFPISPRNSPAAVAYLLVKTNTRHVFVTPDSANQSLIKAASESLTESFKFTIYATPTFESLFPVGNVSMHEQFDAPKRSAENIAAIFHSSGTTSFPKPIYYTNRAFVDFGTMPLCSDIELRGKVFGVHSIPLFHAMASIQLAFSASVGLTLAVFKPHTPPTVPNSDNTLHGILACKCDFALVTPMFIENWVRERKDMETLAKLEFLLHGGGPLAKEAGDLAVSKGIKLVSVYATTECLFLSHFVPKDIGDAWDYFRFSPDRDIRVFDAGDGEYTMTIMSSAAFKPNFINTSIDGVEGYHTNDLIKPHPTREGFWKVVGRADDQIVHSTGEKTNPGPLEKILSDDPHVSGAVVFGQGRFNCGVLVCPKPEWTFDPADETKLAEYRARIWPSVEKMNKFAPSHSRLFKEMIVVTSPNKPLTYTAKGTIRRQASIKEYEAEIDAAFEAVRESSQENIPAPVHWTSSDARTFVFKVVRNTMKVDLHGLDDNTDLFEVGLDSLQATWIRNTIFHALREEYPEVVRRLSSNFVYEYPTIASLSKHLSDAVLGSSTGTGKSVEQKREELLQFVEKHTQNVPAFSGSSSVDEGERKVVLLTGGTGSLGSHILAQLVESEDVTKIYSLSRSTAAALSSKERHVKTFEKEGLTLSLLDSSKVCFLDGDAALPNFGLPADVFAEAQRNVSHIIHNGWRVNFNVSIASFESTIRGVRDLVDFTLASPKSSPPRIIFISSVGVLQNWTKDALAPESLLETPDTAIGSGYSESKWVAERILQNIASKSPLKPTIVRCGQITGGKSGRWNEHEWFPSLVKSSLALGVFPSMEGDVSWVSASDAAGAIIDALDTPEEVLHVVNPKTVPWNGIAALCSSALKLEMKPYDVWLNLLQAKQEEAGSDAEQVERAFERMPALRMIDFFRSCKMEGSSVYREPPGIPRLASERALKVSLALQGAKRVDVEDVALWMGAWRETGFLPGA